MSRRSKNKERKKESAAANLGQFSAVQDVGGAKYKSPRRNLEAAGICALLTILIFSVFGQTLHFEFVNLDDDKNVYATPQVTGGISLQGMEWAFTHIQIDRWTPIATISRLIDCQLFGLWAGGHHLTNILLQTLAAVLLFFALRELTGLTWRSGFVAAVFALHPLHVECVAWVSARGELLGGVFFMLALWSYAFHARKPESRLHYALSLFWFLLGLMSKPMIVTLPFVLLLLDYWPLGRFGRISFFHLVVEKIPFLLLSACSCVVAFIVPPKLDAADYLPLWLRIQNVLASYCIYLRQTFFPADLAAFYPNPSHAFPFLEVAGSLALLCFLSVAVFGLRKRYPALLVGWLWFIGMLVPVIGLVQVSTYAHADRYTYLPQIGLCFAGTWVVADWVGERRYRRLILGSIGCAVLCALVIASHHQTLWWRDSKTLWTHMLECTKDNSIAQNNLGNALFDQGQTQEAIARYHEALRIKPAYAEAHYNLGIALFQQGQTVEAVSQYREALRINPAYVDDINNLGNALLHQGQTEEAAAQYHEALRINPSNANTHNNLGVALSLQGRMEEAVAQYREAVQINPAYVDALNNLGIALFYQGQTEEAIAHTQKALDLQPANLSSMSDLAWMLATAPQAPLRNGARAVQLATQASKSSGGNNPMILRRLAAAYAEAGEFSSAVQTAHNALQLAESGSNNALADTLRRETKLYETGHRFEDPR